jgi:pilus assembly protein CpaF
MHMALLDRPELDAEDDRLILRELLEQARVRARTLLGDAQAEGGDQAADERRLEQLAQTIVDEHQRKARNTTDTPSLANPEQAVAVLRADLIGAGPLEPWMVNPNVQDIVIKGSYRTMAWYADGHKEYVEELLFENDSDVLRLVERFIGPQGRELGASTPMVDAFLARYAARLNAVLPPLSLGGTVVTIRKFAERFRHWDELVERDTLTTEAARLLDIAVQARTNILISGGTGSGKTTLLNVAVCGIRDPLERIITIEETQELSAFLVLPDCDGLQVRFPNAEGRGGVTQQSLTRNALRMFPTRIIIGEIRGPEAWDLINAMNSGHPGGMCTIHADSPRKALIKLVNLALQGAPNMTQEYMAELVGETIELVVQVNRSVDGKRQVTAIAEVVGRQGSLVVTQDLWGRDRPGAPLVWTGVRPERLLEKFAAAGLAYQLPSSEDAAA